MKKLLFILALAAVSCTADDMNNQFCGKVTGRHNSDAPDANGWYDSITITSPSGEMRNFGVPDRFAYPLGSQACK